MERLENSKPVLKKYMVKDDLHRIEQIKKKRTETDTDEYQPIDELEGERPSSALVYEAIRNIKDPEHPYTLEELRVVELDKIRVDDKASIVEIEFTPTIPHCSLATLIGLTIKVKLIRSLPARMKVRVRVAKGTHNNEDDINKQLNDKERVAAAIENKHLLNLVNQGVYNAHNLETIFKEFA